MACTQNPATKKILDLLEHNSVQITPKQELILKLQRQKPLTIKLGMDPTAPDLHLGHVVVLQKMKQFQDLDHQIIFLIGDYTARIGDPTGRSKTRPPLSEEEINFNTKTYFDQVKKILDPAKTTIRYNSEWLAPLSYNDIIKLCAKVTLARITERNDFAERITQQKPVQLHELLYPIMQAYDSVALHADVELGGTDQTFNLLMGRFLQEHYDQEPQVIITTPLLEGIDGTEKMSKSLGNAVGLTDSAPDAFGKLMSLPDNAMWNYFLLLLNKDTHTITQWKEQVSTGQLHPMSLKKEMAHDIIRSFWSKEEALNAQQQFEMLFQERNYDQAATTVIFPSNTANPLWIVDFLKLLHVVKSSSEAKRLIENRGVSIDGISVTDFSALIYWTPGMIIKAGKRHIYKLELKNAK
ncbi:MAG: tyrosine--tRNA ligase [Candidatus Babeliales bacterium]